MAKSHRVYWTLSARQNLLTIYRYISRHNPVAASRLIARIKQEAGNLVRQEIGRLGRVEGTKELIVSKTPYIIVYRNTGKIEILSIRHGAQLWPEAF